MVMTGPDADNSTVNCTIPRGTAGNATISFVVPGYGIGLVEANPPFSTVYTYPLVTKLILHLLQGLRSV
jgi:hypothetical protein